MDLCNLARERGGQNLFLVSERGLPLKIGGEIVLGDSKEGPRNVQEKDQKSDVSYLPSVCGAWQV